MENSNTDASTFKSYLNQGNRLYREKKTDAAARCYRKALALQPDSSEVYNNLGAVCRSQGKVQEAIRCFEQAVTLKPDSPDMNNNFGAMLHERGQSAEAEKYFRKALQLNPDCIDAHYNMGLVQQKQGQLDAAARSYRKALELRPGYAEACHNLGAVLIKQGKFQAAEESLRQALAIRPDYYKVNVDQALLYLMKGNLTEGWRQYEYRYQIREATYLKQILPKWDGTAMPEGTLMVTYEQGLGDTIQFVRYLSIARKRCSKLLFCCQTPLRSLLKDFPGIDAFVDDIGKVRFDAGIGLLSLPHIFGTTVESIPADVPYIYAPDEKAEIWRQHRVTDIFNIGLVWAGNPRHQADWNRSLHLADFAPLAAVPHITFHSLQVGQRSEEADAPPPGMHIKNDTGALKDFADTAGLIENLDLVITVDTSVAHLAGAMGKPVWTLLPYVADWRWLLEREDTPWYPTMRLFRQPEFGNWAAVISRIAGLLREWVSKERPGTVTFPSGDEICTASSVSHGTAPARSFPPKSEPDNTTNVLPDHRIHQAAEFHRQGLGFVQQRNYRQAAQFFKEALALRPDYAKALFNLGVALRSAGKPEEAEAAFERLIGLKSDHAEGHVGLGVVLQEQGKNNEALTAYEKALTLNPHHTEALIGLGIVQKELDRLDEALATYERAHRLKPDHPEVFRGMAMVLREQGRFEEAVTACKKILAITPNRPEVFVSIANTLKAKGALDQAVESYEKAIALAPDHAEAHLFLGLVLLLQGKYETGWREYEWRWQAPPLKGARDNYPMPLWDGTPLDGKTILLHPEQGFGDTIQFVRYAALVKARGGRTVLECEKSLIPLFERIPAVDRIVEKGQTPPMADVHASLLDLPRIFNTGAETIPASVPYLSAGEDLAEKWRKRFNAIDGLKVGIVWAGNPSHKKDRYRSIPLPQLARILNVGGINFFSLQVGARAGEVKTCEAAGHVTDLSADLTDFAETAGAISALDLVISVDTAVAHLAGAMGSPVWVLLPFIPDWRWLMTREDTPWYPAMRLFRQAEHARWEPVFERVAAELAAFASFHRNNPLSFSLKSGTGPGLLKTPTAETPEKHERRADNLAEMKNKSNINKITGIRQCRHGIMLYITKDMYVGRSVELYGEFSESETDIFRQLIRPGDVVIEAGANIGAHTVFLAKAVGPGGLVMAYEPQRFIHQILCANMALNEITNVHARQAALGSVRGHITVPALDYGQKYNFGGVSLGQTPGGEPVLVETIDSMDLKRLRMIKADVEGMEAEVLRGGRETIRKLRPILYVENDRREKSEELISLIQDLDYRLWWHLPPLFNPRNFAGQSENVFGSIVSVNLLCIPRESQANIMGLKEVRSATDHWQ